MVTTRISTVAKAGKEYRFQTNGKVMVKPGWLAVYGREAQEDDANLVAVAAGELARTESIDVKALKTKPPARYTEATLLSAMEGAGKLIDDDELREAMQEKGLGTPATRAAIIEGLIYEKYIHREGRELVPGAKAFQLMTLLRGLGVEDLTKPELTGNWEYQLAEMEKGHLERETFMRQIAEMAERIVKQGQGVRPRHDSRRLRDAGACRARTAAASSRRTTAATPASASRATSARLRLLDQQDPRRARVRAAPRSRRSCATSGSARSRASARRPAGRSPPRSSWCATTSSTTGSSSSTSARTPSAKANRASRSTSRSRRASASARRRRARSTSSAPATSASTRSAPTPPCDFKSGKVILQQPVAREQMTKLLAIGATDLLEGFVSNKTRRKFKARLAWDAKEGKVVFAFEPRPGRAAGEEGAGRHAAAAKPAKAAEAAAAGTAAEEAPAKKAAAKKAAARRRLPRRRQPRRPQRTKAA